MDAVVIESVNKAFLHRPPFWPWLTRRWPRQAHALADLSMRVPCGSVQVVLGPNGSGKTTLLKLISTMLLPDSGRLVVNNLDTHRHGAAVRRMVGFAVVSERSFFPRLTALENLEFFAALEDIPRRQRACRIEELFGVTGLLDHAEKLVMNFSSGMYQRLGIARALLKRPSILLLDEPSRSLDPGSAAHLGHLVRALSHTGVTLVLATHSFQEAVAVGDNVAILCRGTLVAERHMRPTVTPQCLRELYFSSVGEIDQTSELWGEFYDEDAAVAR